MARSAGPSEPSDDDLLAQARDGDEVAIGDLLSRYRPFVRQVSRRYFVPGGDQDDVVQEGMIGLYRAVSHYEPGDDRRFRTFAEVCVTRQIFTAIAAARRRKHVALNASVALPDADDDLDPHVIGALLGDPADVVLASEGAASLGRWCRAALTDLELAVLRGFLDERSYEDIAAELGTDSKAVDNALQRIRRKLRTYLDVVRRLT